MERQPKMKIRHKPDKNADKLKAVEKMLKDFPPK
jgi:hypothetical protein